MNRRLCEAGIMKLKKVLLEIDSITKDLCSLLWYDAIV